jgi:hypothetical protein
VVAVGDAAAAADTVGVGAVVVGGAVVGAVVVGGGAVVGAWVGAVVGRLAGALGATVGWGPAVVAVAAPVTDGDTEVVAAGAVGAEPPERDRTRAMATAAMTTTAATAAISRPLRRRGGSCGP